MSSVRHWLDTLGLSQYADAFEAHDIEDDVLAELDHDTLRELGVASTGHRLRILKAARSFAERSYPDAPIEHASTDRVAADASVSSGDEAEHRQLTVMFCDLVGSTALSERLDPERLRAVMSAYQDVCKRCVERYDGYVARYMGDGVLTYFGYPQAHEDDAERAVRAAIDLATALEARSGQSVRIGIATGPVVVGDLIGEASSQERAVVGETPNLAARLQGVATPGQVVVSSATRRLVAGHFRFRDLGERALKGLSRPARAYAVEGEQTVESRFAATHGGGLSALVGRDEELAMLARRWQLACDGQGQVALLVGEPGIGKSRMCEALGEQLVGQQYRRLRYQCSPHHVDSAFQPVIAQLERAAQFAASDASGVRLDKLERLLTGPGVSLEDDLPLFAALLSLDTGTRYSVLSLAPAEQKERTLSAMMRQLAANAQHGPVLMVFEDVHWVDPSTLDLLHRLVESCVDLPVLVLITFRPEFEPHWTGLAHVTLMALSRLPQAQCRALVADVPGADALPSDTLDEIVAHTDGVPLFIEEMTRSLLESFSAGSSGETQHAPFAVPSSLHDSLMARLDRLPAGKSVAQAVSVIGREFDHELAVEVGDMASAQLDAGLAELTESGLVFQRSGGRYQFKHALVQDAAYESLLTTRRVAGHARVARAMSEVFPARGEAEPEVVAHHFDRAEEWEASARWWRRAATKAGERAATAERVQHLQRAVTAIDRHGADASPEQCVMARLELVTALRVAEAMDEAFDALSAAEAIARRYELDEMRSRVHFQRGNVLFPLGRTEECLVEHRTALGLAERAGSAELQVVALGGISDGEYAHGRMMAARSSFAACVELARAQDLPRVVAPNLAMLGYTGLFALELERGIADSIEACEVASSLNDPRTEVLAASCVTSLLPELGRYADTELQCAEQKKMVHQLGAWRFETTRLQQLARAALGQEQRSRAHEHVEAALALYDRVPESFDKARTLGLLALATDEPSTRRKLLAEGESVIERGCLAHGLLAFYRDAIDTCIELDDATEVERYSRALSDFARTEPMPYTEFHSSRGLAYAELLRGRRDSALRAEFSRLREQAGRAKLLAYAKALDQALDVL